MEKDNNKTTVFEFTKKINPEEAKESLNELFPNAVMVHSEWKVNDD